MRRGKLVYRNTIACALLAMAALGALAAAERPLAGLALAAGLVIGSFNGWLAERSLTMDVAFRATSLGRLAVLSVVALGVGALLGLQNIPLVLIGVAAAQLVLVAFAVSSALEAARK